MLRNACILCCALVFIVLSGCNSESSQKLVLTGSSTVAPLVAEIGRRFEQQHPGVRVDVQSGGSSRGIQDARKGLADIGMVSRSLKPEESDLQPLTIAWDGITVIVHKDNPVSELSMDEVKGIYTGVIRNWRELDGPDLPIVVVNKAEGRSTLELFLHYFGLKNRDIHADVVIGDNQQGLKTVAGQKGAIAYVSIGAAAYEADHGSPIKLLPMGGVDATLDNVEQGRFPIARPLNLVATGYTKPLMAEFVAFARSDSVVDLIQQQFFIPPHAL